MSSAHRAIVILAGVIACGAAAAVPQKLWYASYQDGLDDYKAQHWTAAEKDFLDSIANDPSHDRGTSAQRYGQIRGFIPDYYLALIEVQLEKPADALVYIGTARGYLKSGKDKDEIAALNAAETKVREQLLKGPASKPPDATPAHVAEPAKNPDALMASADQALEAGDFGKARSLASEARAAGASESRVNDFLGGVSRQEAARNPPPPVAGPPPPAHPGAGTPAVTTVPGGSRPAAPPTPTPQEQYDGHVSRAKTALQAHSFTAALNEARQARALGVNNAEADDLIKQAQIEPLTTAINAAVGRRDYTSARSLVDQLEPIDPGNPLIASVRQNATFAASAAETTRAALREFYDGHYQAAATLLEPLSSTGDPRVVFYLACADAALSLVEPDATTRATQQQHARQIWSGTKDRASQLQLDFTYISPAILQVLGIRPPPAPSAPPAPPPPQLAALRIQLLPSAFCLSSDLR